MNPSFLNMYAMKKVTCEMSPVLCVTDQND